MRVSVVSSLLLFLHLVVANAESIPKNVFSLKCQLGQKYIPCEASNKVSLESDNFHDLIVFPNQNAQLSVTFSSKSLNASEPSLLSLFFLNSDEFNSLQNIDSNTNCTHNFTSFISDFNRYGIESANFTVTLPDLPKDDKYYIVFWNRMCQGSDHGLSPVELTYSVISMPPPEGFWTCLAVILLFSGILFCVCMLPCILICCCAQACKKKKKQISYTLDRYPYVAPKPIKCIEKCRLPLIGLFIDKPCNGFLIYYLNKHDLLWICYPEYNQTSGQTKRVLATIGLFLVLFLYQIGWSNWVVEKSRVDRVQQVVPHHLKSAAVWLARLVVADLFILLYRAVYRPYIEIIQLRPSKMILAKSASRFKRILGFIINLFGILIFLVLAALVIYYLHQELNNSVCFNFVLQIAIPFFATSLWRSVPGAITSYVLYRLFSTWGRWPSDFGPHKTIKSADETSPLLNPNEEINVEEEETNDTNDAESSSQQESDEEAGAS